MISVHVSRGQDDDRTLCCSKVPDLHELSSGFTQLGALSGSFSLRSPLHTHTCPAVLAVFCNTLHSPSCIPGSMQCLAPTYS